jgi:hypothetical protein
LIVGNTQGPTTDPFSIFEVQNGDVNIVNGVYKVNGVPWTPTPWTSDVDGGGFVLSNISIGIFGTTPTNPFAVSLQVAGSTNQFGYNPRLSMTATGPGDQGNCQIVGQAQDANDVAPIPSTGLALQGVVGHIISGTPAPTMLFDTLVVISGAGQAVNAGGNAVGNLAGAFGLYAEDNWTMDPTDSFTIGPTFFAVSLLSSVFPGEVFRISSQGNVGIGITNPTSRLSIAGLPTSASGLNPGDVWNNGGVLNIV